MNPKKIIYLSSWIMDVDKVGSTGVWVGVEWEDGEREREKGEGEDWGELGRMG